MEEDEEVEAVAATTPPEPELSISRDVAMTDFGATDNDSADPAEEDSSTSPSRETQNVRYFP